MVSNLGLHRALLIKIHSDEKPYLELCDLWDLIINSQKILLKFNSILHLILRDMNNIHCLPLRPLEKICSRVRQSGCRCIFSSVIGLLSDLSSRITAENITRAVSCIALDDRDSLHSRKALGRHF